MKGLQLRRREYRPHPNLASTTAPIVTTNAATALNPTTATLNATVNPEGTGTAYFNWGLTNLGGTGTLAIDASSPPPVYSTTISATTLAFTPPANAFLVAVCSLGEFTSATLTGTVTDSTSNTWTNKVRSNSSPIAGSAEIWTSQIGATPVSMSVNLTNSDSTGGKGNQLQVFVLTGAATSQVGAATATGIGSSAEISVTATAVGSFIFGALIDTYSGTEGLGVDSLTTSALITEDSGTGEVYASWRSTAITADTAPHTYGFTHSGSASDVNMAALEVLAGSGSSGYSNTTTSQSIAGHVNVTTSASITGLTPNTTYHFQAAAQNSIGTTLGTDIAFTTPLAPGIPTVTTTATTGMGTTTATLNGTCTPNGLSTNAFFNWGLTSAYGNTTGNQAEGSGNSPLAVAQALTGLVTNTVYHYRIGATNSIGTSFGTDMTFITTGAPVVTTNAATSVISTGATLQGTVNPDGQATNADFNYGTTTAYGTTTGVQAMGSGSAGVAVSQVITGLTPSTTYHYRATATNGTGTTNGGDQIFVTPATSIGVPVNSVAPTISGSTAQGSTLTLTSDGTWSPTATGGYTNQWVNSSTGNITGQTGSTYVTVVGDVNDSITCKVTASNVTGASTPASSNSIGPIIVSGGGGSAGIMWIIMENTDWTTAAADSGYFGTLYHGYATATNIRALGHYSGVNYMGYASGIDAYNSGPDQDTGIIGDSPDTNFDGRTTIFNQLHTAGLKWRYYVESGTPGYHEPGAYFPTSTSLDAGSYGVSFSHGSYTNITTDLNSASPPRFMWLGLTNADSGSNDLGGNSLGSGGDSFLSSIIPVIQGTSWYANGGQVLIFFDEGASGGSGDPDGGPIGCVVVSLSTAGKPNYTTALKAAGILGSTEVALGLAKLGTAALSGAGSLGTLLQTVNTGSGGVPVNSTPPVISGSTAQGQLLTTTNGTWTNSPTNPYTYQWSNSATGAISGATHTTYVTVSGDIGDSITCAVTASNASGSSVAAVSNSLTIGPAGGGGTSAQPTPAALGTTWTSLLDDEFAGTTLDLTKWSIGDWGGGSGGTTPVGNLNSFLGQGVGSGSPVYYGNGAMAYNQNLDASHTTCLVLRRMNATGTTTINGIAMTGDGPLSGTTVECGGLSSCGMWSLDPRRVGRTSSTCGLPMQPNPAGPPELVWEVMWKCQNANGGSDVDWGGLYGYNDSDFYLFGSGQPYTEEIDWMEYSDMEFRCHQAGEYDPSPQNFGSYGTTLANAPWMCATFHIRTASISDSSITCYANGSLVSSINPPAATVWAQFAQPQSMIIVHASSSNATTLGNPADYAIDYFRLWKHT